MYKASNIQTPAQIHKYCTEIQTYIEKHYNADNPNAVIDRATSLESFMAISGKLVADAEYHYNELVQSTIMEALTKALDSKLNTSTLNKYVESAARDYKFLWSWADRINRATTHQLDVCRTIISKLKQELYATQRNG